MSKINQDDAISNSDRPQEKNKSTKNIFSKAATAIKSAAEYALVDGVGKTAKNFATRAATGAKQGYGYFNNTPNKDLAKLEELVDEQIKEANKSLAPTKDKYTDLSQDESYKKLGFKQRLDLLTKVIKDISKANDTSLANPEMNEKLGKLEEIVKTQFEILNDSLPESEQCPDLSQNKEYTALKNPKEKIDHLIQLSQSAFVEIGNKLSDWQSLCSEAYNISEALKKTYDAKTPHSTDEITQPSDLESKARESEARVLIKSLNEMYEKSLERRKIEQYKLLLENQLTSLAKNVNISDDTTYKNAQTYEEKIKLIKDKSQLLQKNVTSAQHSTAPNAVTNSGHTANIGRLYTMAEENFASLKAAEEQLLNPKQNRVVRTLKTAAGVIAGSTIGALKGSGAAIKTAAKAVKKADSGIKKTYKKNRSNKQNSR